MENVGTGDYGELDSNEASKRGVTMTKAKLRRSGSVRRYILTVSDCSGVLAHRHPLGAGNHCLFPTAGNSPKLCPHLLPQPHEV